MKRILWIWIILVPVALAACKGGTGKTDTGKTDKGQAGKPTEQPPGKALAADQAVQAWIRAVADGEPLVFWQSLPPSYQKDVQDLIKLFASKMDKDVWDKSFAVLRRGVTVVKQKKGLLLEAFGDQVPPGMIKKDRLGQDEGDAIADLLLVLLNSEISKHDELKKADVEKFLKGAVTTFCKQTFSLAKRLADDPKVSELPDMIKKAKVTLVKSDGKQATVKIEAEGAPKGPEMELVQVDGKWLPKDLADNWSKGVGETRKAITEWKTEDLTKKKLQFMKMLDDADKVLDKLEKAKTKEDIMALVDEAMKIVPM